MSDEKFAFFCSLCKSRVRMDVLGECYENSEMPDRYVFGRCIDCGSPALITQVQTGEWSVEYGQVFPKITRTFDYKLPPKVEISYREALRCESAEAWLATAVMVRRTLEAIGREFDAGSERLFDGLRVMKEKGVISEELWHWGEELRFLGNTGAHATDDVVSKQDGKDAMEFLDAIIENIYHLRPKFQAMRERRKRIGVKNEVKQKTQPPVKQVAEERSE